MSPLPAPMTDTLSDQDRAFLDEVFERRRAGKFGKRKRLAMLQALPQGMVLEADERHRFERTGALPARLTSGAETLPPAPPSAYSVIDRVSTDFAIRLTPPVHHSDGPMPTEKFGRTVVRGYPDIFALEARDVLGNIKNHQALFRLDAGYIREITDDQALPFADTIGWDEAVELSGKTANMSATGSGMFSHWTFDVLPRFKVLAERGHPVESFDHVVISTRNAAFGFHDQGLMRVGVDLDKVRVANQDGPVFRFAHLVEPSKVRDSYFGEPWVYEEVRRIFAGGKPEGGSPGKRLYIGRKNTNKRTVLNMAEIQPVLDAFGFVTVYAEDWSIPEFARIMNQARVIVGPHGAGFSNIAFCEPGTRVMELYGPHITVEFWGISNTLGLQHHILAGYDEAHRYPWEDGAFPVASQKERNAAGFKIDPAHLRRALAAVCEGA